MFDMTQIICERIKLLHLLSVLLLSSEEMHHFWENTSNQSQEQCLSAVNQAHVSTAQCAIGRETIYKTVSNRKLWKRLDVLYLTCTLTAG